MPNSDDERDEGERKWVNAADLRPGPIQHEGLSEDQIQRAKAVFAALQPYMPRSFEQLELNFLRDAEPESEIRVWENIAYAFLRYKQKHGPLVDAEEASLFKTILLMSMCGPKPAHMPQAQWDELVAIYEGRE